MRLEDFDYDLPPGQIAQEPTAERDGSHLLVVPRSGPCAHRSMRDLPQILPPGAVLVFNDTRVIPARLRARKSTGGAVELLVLDAARPSPVGTVSSSPFLTPDAEISTYRCLARSAKPLRPGMRVLVQRPQGGTSHVEAEIVTRESEFADVRFHGLGAASLLDALEDLGEIPLPPYIVREGPPGRDDQLRYQTVFATNPGSVAVPTAGLHFTPELLDALGKAGHEIVKITLHVGSGTFAPIRAGDPREHSMHAEHYRISPAAAHTVSQAKADRRPILAVGTTVVRALEDAARCGTAAGATDLIPPVELGETSLFIYPGFRFRVVDALLTNFHLPRSTLLMLVSALVGRERVLAHYSEAVRAGYRFYSYGDAMLVLPA